MAALLHIVTQKDDRLATETIALHESQPEQSVVIADLTTDHPDYGRLLEQIFAADSIAVW